MNFGWLFRPRAQALLAVAAYGSWAAIVVLSLVPGRDRPHTGMPGDFEHMLAYALAGFATRLALRRPSSVWLAVGFTLAAGGFEIAQHWIAGRSPGLDNWAASAAGAMAGILVAQALKVSAFKASAQKAAGFSDEAEA